MSRESEEWEKEREKDLRLQLYTPAQRIYVEGWSDTEENTLEKGLKSYGHQ